MKIWWEETLDEKNGVLDKDPKESKVPERYAESISSEKKLKAEKNSRIMKKTANSHEYGGPDKQCRIMLKPYCFDKFIMS